MPSFQDQLIQIAIIRQQRRDSEEKYYQNLLDIKETSRKLQQVAQGRKIVTKANPAIITNLQQQITQTKSQVTQVSRQLAQIAELDNNLATARKQISTLTKNIEVIKQSSTSSATQSAAQTFTTPSPAVVSAGINVGTPPAAVGSVVPPSPPAQAPPSPSAPAPAARSATIPSPAATSPASSAPPAQNDVPRTTQWSADSTTTAQPTEADIQLQQFSADLGIAQDNEQAILTQVNDAQQSRVILGNTKTDLETQQSNLEWQLSELTTASINDSSSLAEKAAQLTTTATTVSAEMNTNSASLSDAIYQLYTDPHPRSVLENYNDDTPFLLLPVRLETIFHTLDNGNHELWVRIYPDDVAIHTHEETLTSDEVTAGKLYWTDQLVSEHLTDEKETRKKQAWGYLVGLFGPQRSAWVAKMMKPANWSALVASANNVGLIAALTSIDPTFFDDLAAATIDSNVKDSLSASVAGNNGNQFILLADQQQWTDNVNTLISTLIVAFPIEISNKTDAWSRAPRSYVMPDKFVLILDNGETTNNKREVVGNHIPDTLYVGPEPLEPDNAFISSAEGLLAASGNFAWTTDFQLAIDNGMGFKIPITAAEALNGFKRILALGLNLSMDKDASATMLEALIDNHHYSPNGFELLPIGTSTHNTTNDHSVSAGNEQFTDVAYFTETGEALFQPTEDKDGKKLCDALGISYETLQNVRFSDNDDLLQAKAMNKALYPSTLGYYFQTLTDPIFDANTQNSIRTFFTEYVTGRGPLPSIRVGKQPYGILLTSDLRQWKYAATGTVFGPNVFTPLNSEFLTKLTSFLAFLKAKFWDGLTDQLPHIKQNDVNPDQTMMAIIGQQPSSVAFYQRIGYSLDHILAQDQLQFQSAYASEINLLAANASSLLNFFDANNFSTGLSGTTHLPQLLKIFYQHYTTQLNVNNLIDGKPLSEILPVENNFIGLLANADMNKLLAGNLGIDPAPTSLLYMMLRSGLLLNLYEASFNWFTNNSIFEYTNGFAPQTILGVRAAPEVTKPDILNAKVSLAVPSSPHADLSIGQYLLSNPGLESESAYLSEMKDSLNLLSVKSTSNLERSFTEHLDLCSYRIDAWETALITERLDKLRHNQSNGNINGGINMGAFGWVENLVPSAKTKVDPALVPEKLKRGNNPVFEYNNNGGFVHAPSLDQASAAAFLRSAYMNHASPANPELFQVNLSSDRVRRALFLLEGMKNGQSLEALLGYQFERALHDLSSANGSLNLNQYILNYREAFPLKNQPIPQQGTVPQGTTPQETIQANNVVNGLAIANAQFSSPGYGISLTTITTEEATAILGEQDKLRDSIDAIQDLLTSENAFQLIRGNLDRVAALSNSQKDGTLPPDLEILKTPESTNFSFSNRVTLHFEHLQPGLAASNPWSNIPMSPRAITEPGLNKWLGKLLGRPDKIQCRVVSLINQTNTDGTTETTEQNEVIFNMEQLLLQPVDLLYIISEKSQNGVSELEARIAYLYKHNNTLGNDTIVKIWFDEPATDPAVNTVAGILPLLIPLGGLITGSRHLNAQDFMPFSSQASQSGTENPQGYDVTEIEDRINGLTQGLQQLYDLLNNTLGGHPTQAVQTTPAITNINSPRPLPQSITQGAAINSLNTSPPGPTGTGGLKTAVSNLEAITLLDILERISMYNIPDALPKNPFIQTDADRLAIMEQAKLIGSRLSGSSNSILAKVNTMLTGISTMTSEKKVAQYIAIAKIIFGNSFNLLPRFLYSNPADIASSDTARGQLLSFYTNKYSISTSDTAEDWMTGVSRVRPSLGKWQMVRTLSEILSGQTQDILPVQLPYRENDSWVAVEIPEHDPQQPAQPFMIVGDTLSIVAHGNSAFSTTESQCGVLIDTWTEDIPAKEEITGIAFNYDEPNASPPQALLLAVSPEITGSWQWNDLVETLNNTLDRAKTRTVDTDLLEAANPLTVPNGSQFFWQLMAPALVSEFSTSDTTISLDLAKNLNASVLTQFYSTLINPNTTNS